MFQILFVDDEKNIREGLARAAKVQGYTAFVAGHVTQAKQIFMDQAIDVVVTDVKMPDGDGQQLMQYVHQHDSTIPVIVFTGHATIETAVEIMRLGAYDFLTKPVNLDHLFLLIQRALQGKQMLQEHVAMKNALSQARHTAFKHFVGASVAMHRVFEILSQAAPSKANILLLGESGVGKELAAEAIHALSPRKDKPLIKVHCAALSENLLESELFGHEKGAFTGALARKKGRFELAHQGDLFLDEIGEISSSVQIKLLRVLQERCFERVGGEETVQVDVRIIVATNRDLKKEVEQGRFREDLYYRLNVVQVHLPPLRERKEDIPALAMRFLAQFSKENHKEIEGFTPQALKALVSYTWPGNVRELRNCIESAVVMAQTNWIDRKHMLLPNELVEDDHITLPLGLLLQEVERRYIQATLDKYQQNKSQTADVLGINRRTLHRKLEGDEKHEDGTE
jgi:DNA-binding NtrC family response regulator